MSVRKGKGKGKRIIIDISSSSSDDSSVSSPSEDEYQLIDDDDDDDDDKHEVDDDDDDDEEDKDDAGGHGVVVGDVNCVIRYLKEKKDMRKLSLYSCKSYLRKHRLRVSGNKDECVNRIKEHWRIKDGEAEGLYPRSSFIINCTGDVCKGDVVLFTQKVYDGFDKMTRNGKHTGKRIVAGRVVKESYGAAKQQHTFTVEVLWSKGSKKLSPLLPLLIKGRNLYGLKTYRQPWKNEAERKKVLDEKHSRGAVARSKREKRKRTLLSDKGGKSQKLSHSTRPSQTRDSRKGKVVDKGQMASSSKCSSFEFNDKLHTLKQGAGAYTTIGRSKPFPEDQLASMRSYAHDSQIYSQPLVGSYSRSMPLTSIQFQRVIPLHGSTMRLGEQYNGFSHMPFNYEYNIRSQQMPRDYSHSGMMPGQKTYTLTRCSTHGCFEYRSDVCVIAACQRCCRMKRVECYVHR